MLVQAYNEYHNIVIPSCERESLNATYQGLIEEQSEAFAVAHANQDANAWAIKASYEPKIEAAAQAIREYDAMHPQSISEGVARALRGED